MTFEELFARACQRGDLLQPAPYAFQAALAHDGLPDVLEVPTGAGKTAAVVLAWLWRRRFHPDPQVRLETPRRLVFAVPMRVLVEQVETDVQRWLENLELTEEVDVHVLMGGVTRQQQHSWRIGMDRDAIVIGTVDMIVSKALVRAFGTSRAIWPVDFALITNGSHIVLDEVQLAPRSAATMRQVAAFSRQSGTAEPFGLTCMTATQLPEALDTVDNPWPGDGSSVTLTNADRSGPLAVRLGATKRVNEGLVSAGDPKAIAQLVVDSHRVGTRTLVVVNTVDLAVKVHDELIHRHKTQAHLLHSRFRPPERSASFFAAFPEVASDASVGDSVVVATQVVEAGVDVTSQTLITEAAPWPSLRQRAGRCNRDGLADGARLIWFASKSSPYAASDVEASVVALRELEGKDVTSDDLASMPVALSPPTMMVLRRRDFLDLFDTAPGLSGDDIDISPFIRDGDDLNVFVSWLDWEGDDPGVVLAGRLPATETRCPVPLGAFRALRAGRAVYAYDVERRRWSKLGNDSRPVPGQVYILRSAAGGYLVDTGLSPTAADVVPPIPSAPAAVSVDPETLTDGSTDGQSVAQPGWVRLDVHLDDTRSQADGLLDRLEGHRLDAHLLRTVVEAAGLHDVGKVFDAWQRALAAANARSTPPEAGPWAKSPGTGRLTPTGRPGLRHELVSAAMLHAAADSLTSEGLDVFLLRYLVAAHHGHVRIQLPRTTSVAADGDGGQVLGLRHGDTVPAMRLAGRDLPLTLITLDEFTLGGDRSWSRDALGLLERHGPFELAYLEALVRIADWRASAHPSSSVVVAAEMAEVSS